ncbi:MAG: hypothetical protein AB8G05_21815 [Oligoflexales bacterium]
MRRFIIFMLTIYVCACSNPSRNQGDNRLAPSGESEELPAESKKNESQRESILLGGMSSGGGGTIIANPVSKSVVGESIQEIRRDLSLYINYLDIIFKQTPTNSPAEKLFIQDIEHTRKVLTDVKIFDQNDQACSFLGEDTDGSYHEGQGICLSSLKLSKQLDVINYYPQTIALAAHELAHALGADEETAVSIQQQVLDNFSDTSKPDVDKYVNGFLSQLKELNGTINTSYVSQGGPINTNMRQYINNMQDFNLSFPLSVLSYDGFIQKEDMITKIFNFMLASELVPKSSPLKVAIPESVEKAESIFAGANEVSCKKLREAYWTGEGDFPDHLIPSDCKVRKLVENNLWINESFNQEYVAFRLAFDNILDSLPVYMFSANDPIKKAEGNEPDSKSASSADENELLTKSCVNPNQNTCSNYELLDSFVMDKKAECEENEQGIWGENACIIEGSYSACKRGIGNVDGQEMTWTLYDPASLITKESCESNGGEFLSEPELESEPTNNDEGDALLTKSCVNTVQNSCSTFELLDSFIMDKKAECEENEQGIWGENACVIEGSYSACKRSIGNVDGQEMTWTLYDPTSSITQDSCESSGGFFSQGL